MDVTSPTSGFDPAAAAAEAAAASQEASRTALTDGASNMGRDDFVKLLMAQLQNQDPMNPMDSYEFAGHLAQFSSVEQLININEAMGQNIEATGILTQSTNSGVAAGMIGQSIEAVGDQVNWDGNTPPALGFELSRQAENVTIEVLNASGAVIRTISLGERTGDEHQIEWNGQDNDGKKVPEGVYSFRVNATDQEGEPIASQPIIRGTVSRVSFSQEGTRLWIGDVPVPLSQIRAVEAPES